MSGMPSKIPDDKFTMAWMKTQYDGVCHALGKLSAENMHLEKKWAALCDRYEEIATENASIMSKFGDLIQRMEVLEVGMTERLDDFSSKYWELKNKHDDLAKKHDELLARHVKLGNHVNKSLPVSDTNGAAT